MAVAASSASDPVGAARALRGALATLSNALAAGHLAGILDAEPELTAALASMRVARGQLEAGALDGERSLVLASELRGARTLLERCTALGASLGDVVRHCGALAPTYDRAGTMAPAATFAPGQQG